MPALRGCQQVREIAACERLQPVPSLVAESCESVQETGIFQAATHQSGLTALVHDHGDVAVAESPVFASLLSGEQQQLGEASAAALI